MDKKSQKLFNITKEMQIKELERKVPPVLNVDIVVFRRIIEKSERICEFLIGRRNEKHLPKSVYDKDPKWLFPGGRVSFKETPQEATLRILKTELPGIKAQFKKLATAISDMGYDYRANGVTLYYLYEYDSGYPKKNDQLDDFFWGTVDDIKNKKEVYVHDKSVLEELEALVRTVNTSEDELLVEVDKENKEIGTIIKRVAHSTNKRYHRAAHMMIFNSKGEVVLQQRSLNKTSGAGLWDMHGGHQAAGHTIEQTAQQELSEELGIHVNLILHRVFLYKSDSQAEYCHVYYGVHDGPYGFDRNEVQQVKAFDCEKLLNGDYDNEYEFVFFAKQYTEELKDVWKKLKKEYKNNN